MRRPLQPVAQPSRPRMLNSREEILAWVEEGQRMLSALAEAEGLGQGRPGVEHTQLELREVA